MTTKFKFDESDVVNAVREHLGREITALDAAGLMPLIDKAAVESAASASADPDEQTMHAWSEIAGQLRRRAHSFA